MNDRFSEKMLNMYILDAALSYNKAKITSFEIKGDFVRFFSGVEYVFELAIEDIILGRYRLYCGFTEKGLVSA